MALPTQAAIASAPPDVATSAQTAPKPAAPRKTPWTTMVERARVLAKKPLSTSGETPLPPALQAVSYDEWRALRFRPEQAVWRDEGLPFQLQLFHRAGQQPQRVEIAIADGAKTTPLPWSTSRFRYDPPASPELEAVSKDVGAAGFRVHHPLNTEGVFDEVAVFLGASYFRVLGKGQVWGLSARALAIDVAENSGEEFPFFRAFTIEKPVAGSTSITVHALLDSASVTGAYRFVITPGVDSVVDVDAVVFARKDVRKLGLAPLTSMFQLGELRRGSGPEATQDDFRPEVHDSDGLALFTGSGEQVWRPLRNPKHVGANAFVDDNPRGFGLLQRDRAFDHYQDLETRAELRPSMWVEPKGSWGRGHVELVELPTDNEYLDNVVAFWRPAEPLRASTSRTFSYRLHTVLAEPVRVGGDDTLGRVVSTRGGSPRALGHKPAANTASERSRVFIVDFEGQALADLPADAAVTAVLTTTKGTLGAPVVQKNHVTKGWRVSFTFTPDAPASDAPAAAADVADLRLALVHEGRLLTETWTVPCP